MSEADELQRRAEKFADDTIRFIQGLPNTLVARRLGAQLLDSATSVAANYRAARHGRSHREFTAKIRLVSEESDETVLWLHRIINAKLKSDIPIRPLLEEAEELARIFGASYRTARRRYRKRDDDPIQ